MKLRKLELRDAERMLLWMHDPSVVAKLQTNFADKTIDDCRQFIEHSVDKHNVHMVIADDNDIYMGTVSLKHITEVSAEFAITICKEAMGRGYSKWAMKEMLNIAFNEYKLKTVIWCVAPDNLRAIKFYDKNNYQRVDPKKLIDIIVGYSQEQIERYIWYAVSNERNMHK